MWVRWFLIVGAVKASVLAAMTLWAMGETIERAEIKLMPMQAVPVERAGQWTPPAERLADIVDEMKQAGYPAEIIWGYLMREAARVKHEG